MTIGKSTHKETSSCFAAASMAPFSLNTMLLPSLFIHCTDHIARI